MPSADVSPLNQPVIHAFFSVAYLFVFLATIIGNTIILIVFVSQRRMRSVPNFFLANLTIADLFVGIFCVIQNGAHFVLLGHGQWPFGELLCHTYIYLLHLIPNVSAGVLVLVSVERLFAVLRPLSVREAFTKRVLVSSSAFVWIGSAIMNLPYFYASQYIEFRDGNETMAICTRRHVEWNGFNLLKVVTTVNFIVWYAFPLMSLFFIYSTIGIVIRQATRTDRLVRVSSEKKDTLIPDRREWKSDSVGITAEKRRRVGRLSLGIVLSFACLSLPRYLYLIWSVWRDANAPRCLSCYQVLLQPLTFLLLFLNSAINPFLYAFLSQKFRESIRDTISCRGDTAKRRDRAIELSIKRQLERRANSRETNDSIAPPDSERS